MQSAQDRTQLGKWWRKTPVTVFCSCALHDEPLLVQLGLHLRPLEQAGILQVWSFRHLPLGANRAQQMEGCLKSAALILLLLSADFFASEECLEQMKCALARYENGEARLIPIPLRPIIWQQTVLASYTCLPSNGQAVTEWTNLDAAFDNIAWGVLRALGYPGKSPLALSGTSTAYVYPTNPYSLPLDTLEILQDSFEVSKTSKQYAWRYLEGRQPPTDPRTIIQREKIVRQVYEHLTQPDVTAVTLTGIGGNGKSTLAGLVYNYAEEQRKTDTGPFRAKAIWLTIDSSVTIGDLAGTLYKHLGLPFRDIQVLAPQHMAAALYNAMNTVEKPRLLILDEFQSLFVSPSSQMERPGIGEWLDALNSRPCTCRVLLTCSFYPRSLHNYPCTYLQEYCLPSLDILEGKELLYKQGMIITPAIEEEVHLAVKTCQGHVHALVLLASLLRENQSLNLSALLHDPAYRDLWIGDIAHNLLDHIYIDQLNEQQRSLVRGFSLYREPVPLQAVQEFLPRASLRKALHGLLALHLLQAVGALRYRLHTIVSAYAQNHFVEGDEQANRQALQAAHARAAEYYQKQAIATCPPHGKRQSISDICPLIETCWHLCQGQQQQAAFALMEREAIFIDLESLGGSAFLYELCQLLLSSDQWRPQPSQAGLLYARLAYSCNTLGKKEEALKYFVQALTLYRQIGDRKEEFEILNSLGSICADLGNRGDACKYIEEALVLSKEIGDHKEEAAVLNNLGKLCSLLGKREEALYYYQLALKMMREVDDQYGEGVVLNNLGKVYGDLGKQEEALSYYQQALDRRRQLADRWGEGVTLNNLGGFYDEWGNKVEALRCYQQALEIKRQLTDRWGEGVTLHNLGRLYDEWGDSVEALRWYQSALCIRKKLGDSLGEAITLNNLGGIYSAMGKKEEAQEQYERALYLEQKLGDVGGEGVTLHNLGRLYSDWNRKTAALNYYCQALLRRRLVGDRKGEGMTLHNIGVLYFEQGYYNVALASLILAKTIFDEIGSSNRYASQKKIYQLRRKVGVQYQALETSVKMRAMQIVEQALREKCPPRTGDY